MCTWVYSSNATYGTTAPSIHLIVPSTPFYTLKGYFDGGRQPTMLLFEGDTAPSQYSDTSATGSSHRSENTSSLDGQWGPVPISVDPNRPDYSTPTPSALPVVNNHGGTIDTAALVGITISAAIIVLAVVITIIWWTRTRSKNRHGFGHGQQRQQRPRVIEEEEEKPPTYEAAVFGIYRNDQTVGILLLQLQIYLEIPNVLFSLYNRFRLSSHFQHHYHKSSRTPTIQIRQGHSTLSP